jgi:hypothetical protein
MRKDQKHALIVDAKHSRLYLYENTNDGPRLMQDFYVSQGKLGINKLKEGDMRTPVGVYYLIGRLPGVKLPDMYGKGAAARLSERLGQGERPQRFRHLGARHAAGNLQPSAAVDRRLRGGQQ